MNILLSQTEFYYVFSEMVDVEKSFQCTPTRKIYTETRTYGRAKSSEQRSKFAAIPLFHQIDTTILLNLLYVFVLISCIIRCYVL